MEKKYHSHLYLLRVCMKKRLVKQQKPTMTQNADCLGCSVPTKGTATFIPKSPLIKLNGKMLTVIIVRIFMTWFRWLLWSVSALSTTFRYESSLRRTIVYERFIMIWQYFNLPCRNFISNYFNNKCEISLPQVWGRLKPTLKDYWRMIP